MRQFNAEGNVAARGGAPAEQVRVDVNPFDSQFSAYVRNLLDGNLGESGVMALGASNALYADVDGAPGIQMPPLP